MRSSNSVFVYGTLMAPEVLKVLIGRIPECSRSALLLNYRRHPVKDYVFPAVIPCESGTMTEGILLHDLSKTEMKVLDCFEGEEYFRADVTVTTSEGETMDSQCYVWSKPQDQLDLTKDWDYYSFRNSKLNWYLASTVLPCRRELDRVGI
jgi:gamma-glutamylcyclotransferase (GGCT)/AIG2-like uncharacterized protein YtfP